MHGLVINMVYKVLSLKWRPQSFDEIIGQESLVKTLVNAFAQDRIAQGYIFTGPRGVGKTTTARIMAMALNAENGPKSNFDPKSNVSMEIAEARSMDVLEIDGASNRGIEEIRGLREQIKFAPVGGAFKIIIIDEVHMLTNQAFNALLRTLEEPPSHVKFIFATTDIHKVPPTIISRCQRFDFNRISISAISQKVHQILEAEKITSDPESIHAIARKADGSMRDALSMLDQVISYSGGDIKYELTAKALGLIELDLFFSFTESIYQKDHNTMISLLKRFSDKGVPAKELIIGIEQHIRNIIYACFDSGLDLLEMNKEQKNMYKLECEKWDRRDLYRICQVLMDTLSNIHDSEYPYLILEMTALKLLEMDKSIYIDEILSGSLGGPSQEVASVSLESDKSTKLPDYDKNIEPKILQPKTKTSGQEYTMKQNDEADKIDKVIVPSVSPSQKNLVDTNTENIKTEDEIVINDDKKNPNGKIDEMASKISLDPEFNLKKIVELWPKLLEGVNKSRPSVGAILEEFTPDHYDGNTLTLKQNKDFIFNHDIIQRGINIIQQEQTKIFGNSFKLKFAQAARPVLKNETVSENSDKIENNNEEVFNKVVDLFDGEILH